MPPLSNWRVFPLPIVTVEGPAALKRRVLMFNEAPKLPEKPLESVMY